MCSPSIKGVGLAGEFLSCIGCPVASAAEKTSVSHSNRPVALSKQSRRSDGPLSVPFTPDVRNIRPRPITGEDQPEPGTACFHTTFFSADHSIGRFVAV